MNKVQLVGRLTRDPELKTTGNGVSVCSFTVAVNRKYKNADGEYEADFINCVAWRQSAEFLCKYFYKGSMIGVVGSIQTRNYEKDGQRVYITEVSVDEVEPLGASRTQSSNAAQGVPNESDIDFGAFAPTADDELPY
ncbi:MAG: single-stranded DNA-binding protein [Clostridia bacterium]|nr:single-stranded DNA-binding protein [Clostridia bacterium]